MSISLSARIPRHGDAREAGERHRWRRQKEMGFSAQTRELEALFHFYLFKDSIQHRTIWPG